ncbi:MlaD family protein [Bartonella sp. HY329]|uniref:MlaD family protein n=1 Tax=unclassified Bartonella TaxID=2645622 RepID=UPI0021C5BF14|nr:MULTISPECIES: MlaD family protein [unclassified Bartonella]UXM93984.1 MlaD family protein [Bartonella sp. HY329]UXN08305.1 MlaD family protein [Bartonella sp. HY328]
MSFRSRIINFIKINLTYARLVALVSITMLPACSFETDKGTLNIVAQIVSFGDGVIKAFQLATEDEPQFHVLDISFPATQIGINSGAAVYLNHIRIGTVKEIFAENEKTTTVVRVAINSKYHVSRSTVAHLSFQGLTGMCQIELSNSDKSDEDVVKADSKQGLITQIIVNKNFENPCK